MRNKLLQTQTRRRPVTETRSFIKLADTDMKSNQLCSKIITKLFVHNNKQYLHVPIQMASMAIMGHVTLLCLNVIKIKMPSSCWKDGGKRQMVDVTPIIQLPLKRFSRFQRLFLNLQLVGVRKDIILPPLPRPIDLLLYPWMDNCLMVTGPLWSGQI